MPYQKAGFNAAYINFDIEVRQFTFVAGTKVGPLGHVYDCCFGVLMRPWVLKVLGANGNRCGDAPLNNRSG
jgi:hypothetical protein